MVMVGVSRVGCSGKKGNRQIQPPRPPDGFRFVLVQTAWQSQRDLPNSDSMSVHNSTDWLVDSNAPGLLFAWRAYPNIIHRTIWSSTFAMASPVLARAARLRPCTPVHQFLVLPGCFRSISAYPQPPSFPHTPRRATQIELRVSAATGRNQLRLSSSTAAPLSTAPTPQPLAKGAQVTSPCDKSYIIDETIYQRQEGKRLYCLYSAR